MGREAQGEGCCGAESGPVKALLEANEIVLRGAIRRRFERGQIQALCVSGDRLSFRVAEEDVSLELGAKEAAAWLRKLSTPPPSLADKLGIGPDRKALLFGEMPDPVLREALRGFETKVAGEAVLALAVVTSAVAFAEVIAAYRKVMPAEAPLWIVHPKGAKASLKEAEVRAALRGLGFIDTKSCGVSETFTATRYARRRTGA
jgi:hypothetical protein